MIEYLNVNPVEYKDSLLPLNILHYADDHRKEVSSLAINWEAMSCLHSSDRLKTVIAKDGEEVVGYISVIVTDQLHNSDKLAVMDALYVKESHRRSGISTDLLIEMEEVLIEMGVPIFGVGFRSKDLGDKVMSPLGYNLEECTYTKVLKEIE